MSFAHRLLAPRLLAERAAASSLGGSASLAGEIASRIGDGGAVDVERAEVGGATAPAMLDEAGATPRAALLAGKCLLFTVIAFDENPSHNLNLTRTH